MAGTTVPSMFAGLPNDLIINIVKQEHRRSMIEESLLECKNKFAEALDDLNTIFAESAEWVLEGDEFEYPNAYFWDPSSGIWDLLVERPEQYYN
jgi:hypothetical protein